MSEPSPVYEPLCRVPYCPAPSSDEWHRCFVCGKMAGDHVEVEDAPWSLVEDPPSLVFLCRRCQKKLDSLEWSNAILDLPGRGRVYRVWQVKDNKTVKERVLLLSTSLGGEDVGGQGEQLNTAGRRDTTEASGLQTPLRPLAPRSLLGLVAQLRDLDDEELAYWLNEANVAAGMTYLFRCATIFCYRERWRYINEGWQIAAYKLFGYYPSTLRQDAAFCEFLLGYLEQASEAEQEHLSELPDRWLRPLARALDKKAAINIAISLFAEQGIHEVHVLIARLKAEGLLPIPTHYTHVCLNCGSEDVQHKRKEPVDVI